RRKTLTARTYHQPTPSVIAVLRTVVRFSAWSRKSRTRAIRPTITIVAGMNTGFRITDSAAGPLGAGAAGDRGGCASTDMRLCFRIGALVRRPPTSGEVARGRHPVSVPHHCLHRGLPGGCPTRMLRG